MPSSPDTFISVDLETTGLDSQLNEIIEIGAVRVENGEITAEYSEFVKPERSIPDFITKLTGISDKDVRNAGSIREVLPSFLDFISGYELMGQNVAFDVGFLRKAAGVGKIGKAIDNIDLARILLPMLPSYSLDSLIDFFALEPENRHRALDDARVTAVIFLKFIDMLRVAPEHFLKDMLQLSTGADSALGEIFKTLAFERMSSPKALSDSIGALKNTGSESGNNLFGNFATELPPPSEYVDPTISQDAIQVMLADGGGLSKVYENFEERSGQISFARSVANAFNESEILIAEAGTGTGKSVAYLIPAVCWAEKSRERVVISTNTKNLQEQLFHKDIPHIGKVLDFPFRAVILKGRGNYICIHRWERLVGSSTKFLSKEERNLLLPVASWLLRTKTGDLSETGFYSMMGEQGLLERINSDSISCLGPRCKSRDTCYVNRVRRAAQRAHVIIVNHSLVFSDMVTEGAVLGPYNRLVFDEAHNIEKVALQYLGVSFTYYRVRRILNRLHASNDKGRGLLVMLRSWVDDVSKGWPEFKDNAAILDNSLQMVKKVRSVTLDLFEHLLATVKAAGTQSDGSHEGKLRYDESSTVFPECTDQIDTFYTMFSMMIKALEDVKMLISGTSSGHLKDKEEVITDIEKAQLELQAVVNDLEFLIEARGQNVFWFEYNDTGRSYSLKVLSAPLDVAEKLASGLYDHMETVVMTSATLTVARDFSYIRKRLGLDLDIRERIAEFIASSPFDYQQQAAVIVPTFLPSPKQGSFIDEASELLVELSSNIRRGMLVLFTSRGHLHRTYNDLRDPLAHRGITLLGQGIDGSRSLLLRRFRDEERSILLGTDSFWEGIDVPGKALEIVVIAKLPFAVPSEPVVQAQMEEIERTGGNSFMDYSVPEAAIKLRQGAGRLIRHRNDKGIVVVLDTRIVTTRYGSIFKRCLPGSLIKSTDTEQFIKSVQNWFGE